MKKLLIAILVLSIIIAGGYLYMAKITKPTETMSPAIIKPIQKDNPSAETSKLKYTIPYKAEGNFENLYKNLKETTDDDKKIEIISFAKGVAKDAGYSIFGDNLDKYRLNDAEYSMEVIVYENSEFYIISLLPISTPTTSNNLEIGIQKNNNKIISILKGS